MSNLLSFLYAVTTRLDEWKAVELCYLDFRKAFHSVTHRLLILKMEVFDIPGELHKWVKDFFRR